MKSSKEGKNGTKYPIYTYIIVLLVVTVVVVLLSYKTHQRSASQHPTDARVSFEVVETAPTSKI